MVFHILTIFPDFFQGPFQYGVVAKAAEAGLIQIHIHDLRTWTHDRHRTVDDRPFGGGEGMLLKPAPDLRRRRKHLARAPAAPAPGPAFRPRQAFRSGRPRAASPNIRNCSSICGRYEGVDERVAEHLADEELSIGDFVLSGGELAAALVVDCVARLLPGVLGQPGFGPSGILQRSRRLLDCPQYTRPADFRGWKVPEVLLSGNHEEIRRWRRQAARDKTARNRPDLLQ